MKALFNLAAMLLALANLLMALYSYYMEDLLRAILHLQAFTILWMLRTQD